MGDLQSEEEEGPPFGQDVRHGEGSHHTPVTCEERGGGRGRGERLEAEVQIVADMAPELFGEDGLRLPDLVQGLLEGRVTDSEGGPHGQVGVKEVSLESVAGAGDDGEGGVGEGAGVELGRSPKDHRVVPVVSFERQEAAHVGDAISHDGLWGGRRQSGEEEEEEEEEEGLTGGVRRMIAAKPQNKDRLTD
jgi:hypothetical protein